MRAISNLFDETRIVILERKPPVSPNLMPITGHRLSVHPLPEPSGEDFSRKISILLWLVFNFEKLWREIKLADVLHINVPGDLGGIAILLGLLQKKKMFIRHCGTWDQPVTAANRALLWLLERIADNTRTIVFATGSSDQPPSAKNRNISWVFSTTLEDDEFRDLPQAEPWRKGMPLKLISVGRLTVLKNMQAIIEALPKVINAHPNVHLRIVGDGAYENELKGLVREKKLGSHVEFTGNLDHAGVMQVLTTSHLFVFPTNVKEGFPKAVLEALACGLPVIATRVSVIPQLLKNGSGLLLDDTSAPAVADAILNLLSQPEQLAGMGRLAREAAQGYTLEAWGEAIGQRLRAAWGPLRSDKA